MRLVGDESPASAKGHGRPAPLLVIGAIVVATLVARRLGYPLGGRVVVRCRRGHLSTTLWIPGISLKGLDFGLARWQRCPVGNHWSLLTPVKNGNPADVSP